LLLSLWLGFVAPVALVQADTVKVDLMELQLALESAN